MEGVAGGEGTMVRLEYWDGGKGVGVSAQHLLIVQMVIGEFSKHYMLSISNKNHYKGLLRYFHAVLL